MVLAPAPSASGEGERAVGQEVASPSAVRRAAAHWAAGEGERAVGQEMASTCEEACPQQAGVSARSGMPGRMMTSMTQ